MAHTLEITETNRSKTADEKASFRTSKLPEAQKRSKHTSIMTKESKPTMVHVRFENQFVMLRK